MEDLLETLVGEIFDELDEPRTAQVQAARGILVVDAAYSLAKLREHFGIPVEAPPRVETAGGYIAWAAGRIPQAGERFVAGGLEFDVLESVPTRVVRLVVRSAPPPAGPGVFPGGS
jgi:CBS domain containing-hemolysin-like protein